MNKIIKFSYIIALLLVTAVHAMEEENQNVYQQKKLELIHELGMTPEKEILNAKLIKAAMDGNNEEVEQLIAAGADVNAQIVSILKAPSQLYIPPSQSYIYIALDGNKIQRALALGGIIDLLNTPLIKAALLFHPQTCALLIAKGANVNTQDTIGYTALMYALNQPAPSLEIRLEVCRILIACGARVDITDKSGDRTPLKMARAQPLMELIFDALINQVTRLTPEQHKSAVALLATLNKQHPRAKDTNRMIVRDFIAQTKKENLHKNKELIIAQINKAANPKTQPKKYAFFMDRLERYLQQSQRD